MVTTYLASEALERKDAAIPIPTPPEKHRFHLLDALRGLAALMVVTYHAPLALRPYITQFPNSFLAVDFFFCLSGFVIAFSYERRLLKNLTPGSFISLRLIRLYPLYLIGTIIVLLRTPLNAGRLQLMHSDPRAFAVLVLASLFFIPAFWSSPASGYIYPFNVPAWSLGYELLANLVYAVIVKLRHSKALLAAICFVGFLPLLYAGLHRADLDQGAGPGDFLFGVARVGFSFPAGILIFHLFRGRFFQARKWTNVIFTVAITTVMIAGLAFHSSVTRSSIIQLVFIAVISPGLVFFGAKTIVPPAFNKICAVLGDMSYPLYVLQAGFMLPTLGSPRLLHWMQGHGAATHVLFPLYCLSLGAFAWAVGHYVDVPVRKWLTQTYKRYSSKHTSANVRQQTTLSQWATKQTPPTYPAKG